ncbi:MAG: MogA/MoaB family molybdenum cofactor biosynthesis protein [Dehalococcoidia bacterium]|nr:MogA/MoaB family molybdenum cofactor biosynthesis protein [Dehalococcoidia bacterium]
MARIAILTVSDSGAAGGRGDVSGDTAERRCIAAGHTVAARAIVADERESIAARLREWADSGIADWVVTTGGTGLTERDVTPEATRDVAERDVPGVPVALWVNGLKQTPFAVLSRGVAVQRKRTVIVNLPGNPRAVAEGMDVLLPLFPHAARLMAGPMEHTTPADSGRA